MRSRPAKMITSKLMKLLKFPGIFHRNLNFSLNNAILNESFVLSPNKEVETTDTTKRPAIEGKENDRNALNDTDLMLAKFDSMKIQNTADKMKITERPQIPAPLSDARPLKSRQQLFPKSNSILKEKRLGNSSEKGLSIFSHLRQNSKSPKKEAMQEFRSQVEGVPTVFQKARESHKKAKPLQDEIDSGIDTGALNLQQKLSPKNWMSSQPEEKPVADTPLKNNDSALFVTPQVKSFRVPSLRTQSHQLTNQLMKKQALQDFSRQKVLFTTPVGVPRPPSSGNDSLSLSIEDTPVKNKENLINQKLSPINEIKLNKKSSETLFPSNCGFSSDEAPDSPDEGKNILIIKDNKYVVEDKLGSGGSSSVFLAKDKRNRRQCAIKVSSGTEFS